VIRGLLVFRRLVCLNVMSTLEYRGGFFIYMLEAVLVPVISLLVWLTVSEQSGGDLPYSDSQFVTYYILLSLVTTLTGTWLGRFVARNIRQGEISAWLLRPISYLPFYAANNVGNKLVKLPLLLPIVAAAGLAFWRRLEIPADPSTWLLFLASIPMAAALSFLIDFVIGSLAFWIQDVDGLIRAKALIGSFLAGQLIPLALFPPSLEGFLEAQPFRYTLSFPLEILTGSLSAAELAGGFAWQSGYCVAFYACYRLVWRWGLPSYSASGA
jgi:ABC-2 type transport system permease protein